MMTALMLANRLTNVSSVDYLANLQYLDVSHNQIDSVNGESVRWSGNFC